jgi:hypothetical protein
MSLLNGQYASQPIQIPSQDDIDTQEFENNTLAQDDDNGEATPLYPLRKRLRSGRSYFASAHFSPPPVHLDQDSQTTHF